MQITITMPESIEWASRDVDFALDLTKVPADKLAELIATAAVMGFKKAGVDAAASAKEYAKKNSLTEEDATTELTDKKIAVWEAGDWGATRSGDGMSRIERTAVSAVRDAVKAQDERKYKDMNEQERFAACSEYFDRLSDQQRDGLRRWAAGEVARRDAAKAAQKALDIAIKI